jgi:thiol-disulfide isomerase/thioredoxin
MKSIFFTTIFLLFALTVNAQKKYSITGEFINLPNPAAPAVKDGDTIRLEVSSNHKLVLAIIKNNKFEFSGIINEPSVAFLTHSHGGMKILLDNSTYTIKLKQAVVGHKDKITYYDLEQNIKTDSKFHNLWVNFKDKIDSMYARKDALLKKIDKSHNADSMNVLKREVLSLDNNMNFSYKRLALENPDNYATPYMLHNALDFSYKSYIGLFNSLSERVRESFLGKQLYEKLIAIKSLDEESIIENEHTKGGSNGLLIGREVPEIKAINVTGEKVLLSNNLYQQGKFTLIEFWASWCVPCRQVNIDLHAKRDEYRKLGLNIIGFSLDENFKNWAIAVKKDNTGWMQISDLKALNSPFSAFIKLESIPANILVDSKGKVIAQNIYKGDLDDFLKRSN